MTARTSILCNSNINPLKTREMKKLILMMGVVFGALTLTNCTNDIDEGLKPEAQTKDFALTVLAGDNTRTSIDDFTTSWTAGDQINLFYGWAREAGNSTYHEYASANAFTINNPATNTFTGKVPVEFDEAAEYRFYAVYPYNAALTTPANGKATMVVGKTAQTQNGNNNTAHLCGVNAPLIGKTEPTNTPAITMNHAAAYMELNIKNASREAMTIQSIKVDANQNIAGEYVVTFGRDIVLYSATEDSAKSVTLTVNNAEALAAGQTGKYYVAVKPFTAEAGDTVSFTITTDKGEFVFANPLSTDLTLTAGKVKKISLMPSTTMTKIVREWTYKSEGAWQIVVENKSSVNWTVKALTDASWVDIWYDENKNYFGAQPKYNYTGKARSARFYVIDEDGTVLHELIINQESQVQNVNPSDLEFIRALITEGLITYADGSRYKLHADLQPENLGTSNLDGWLPGSGITIKNIDGTMYITRITVPTSVIPWQEEEAKKVVLHGLPEVVDLPKLEYFNLWGHETLAGSEMPKVWNTPELTYFNVGRTRMTGVIPDGLAASPKLAQLWADGCDFYGALPHNWASDKLEILHFGAVYYDGLGKTVGSYDLGYMVPASFNVVLPSQRVAQGDKVHFYLSLTLEKVNNTYENWLGYEYGWGQNRYVEFGGGAADDLTTFDKFRWPGYNPTNDENGNNAWTSGFDGWLPHKMLEWNQVEADAYTAQCKADRGLL